MIAKIQHAMIIEDNCGAEFMLLYINFHRLRISLNINLKPHLDLNFWICFKRAFG